MLIERIKGLLYQELFITYHSLEVLMDLLFFSVISAVTFGFFTLYSSADSEMARNLYMGILFMEIIRITQYTTSLNALWNIWSRNLSNLFIAPLSVWEYISSQMISGAIKAGVIFLLISFLAKIFFQFDIFLVGPLNLVLFYINLVLFSWTLGIAILGFIFKFGSKYSAFAWSLVFLFQPIIGTFFPVSVLPSFLQKISYSLPPTYIFEAARQALASPVVNWDYVLKAVGLNLIYLILSLWFFKFMFEKSKESGQFARNEG